MRISDWSSDVCSSDLEIDAPGPVADRRRDAAEVIVERRGAARIERRHRADDARLALGAHKIGGRGDEPRPGHDRSAESGFQPSGAAAVIHRSWYVRSGRHTGSPV